MLLVLVGLIIGNAAESFARPIVKGPATAAQSPDVMEIKKLGGRVTFDLADPDRPVTLIGSQFVDAHMKHLKGFTKLQMLLLTNSQITDAAGSFQIAADVYPRAECFCTFSISP